MEMKLHSFVKNNDTYPCFLWPVVCIGERYYLLCSDDENKKITNIREIQNLNFDIVIKYNNNQMSLSIGDNLPYIYAFSGQTIIISDQDSIRDILILYLNRLIDGDIIKKINIFKLWEVAYFANHFFILAYIYSEIEQQGNTRIIQWIRRELDKKPDSRQVLHNRSNFVGPQNSIPKSIPNLENVIVEDDEFTVIADLIEIAYMEDKWKIQFNGNLNEADEHGQFKDRTLLCKECGAEFTFSAPEQEFYSEKGFQNDPARCPECRTARKRQRNGEREMYAVICAKCGCETQVPFRPTEDRPVYCSKCKCYLTQSSIS